MISAPLRTTKTHTTQTQPAAAKPSVKLHGHLALLEWDETLPSTAAAPFPPFGLQKRSVIDRCYDGGTVLLLAVTAAALAASLCRF